MHDLDFTRLREHLETAARPPTFAEIRGRRSARTRRTAVLAAALATAAALVGSGTAVALLSGRARMQPAITQTATLPPSPSPTTLTSKGNQKKVPNVSGIGYDVNEAKVVLAAAGFTDSTRIVMYPRTTLVAADNGKVVDQTPQADSLADPTKDLITLFIGFYSGGQPTGSASQTAA